MNKPQPISEAAGHAPEAAWDLAGRTCDRVADGVRSALLMLALGPDAKQLLMESTAHHLKRVAATAGGRPIYDLEQPVVAPFGVPVTAADVQDVWAAFVAPTQSDDAPPQSVETRALMGILRAVYTALTEGQEGHA